MFRSTKVLRVAPPEIYGISIKLTWCQPLQHQPYYTKRLLILSPVLP